MVKKVVYGVSAILALAVIFIIADYFALFGTSTKIKLDFVETNIRTIDAETGSLVFEVGVRCFQHKNDNACTRRESHRAGVVSVHIPVRRVIKKTLLFKKSEELIKAKDPKIHIMLIHQDYYNPTKTVLLDDIYTQKVIDYTVEMKPRQWDLPEGEADE